MSSYELSPVRLVRRPLHPLLLLVPVTCFVGALLTDIAYWRTAEMMWTNFSAWLITAGILLGCLAALAGLVDLFGRRYAGGPVGFYVLGNVVALGLAALNMLVHTHDGWTSVVPWGLALSAATVIVVLVSGAAGWSMLYRRDVEVLQP